MESPLEKNDKSKQVCTITVIFPVESDEDAIIVKKKIGEAIGPVSEARIDFRIMQVMPRGV